MEMIALSEFAQTMRQWVDVPLPSLIEQAVRKACRTFCRQSDLVIYAREFASVFACQSISIIGTSAINREHHGALKASNVLQVTAGEEMLMPGRDYHQISQDQVHFLNDYADVRIVCSLEPSHAANEVPRVLFDDYLDGICAGAAASLLMQEGEWGNPNLAQILDRQFVESYREAARFRRNALPDAYAVNRTRKRDFY